LKMECCKNFNDLNVSSYVVLVSISGLIHGTKMFKTFSVVVL
jgi:hypothetical protein